MLKSLRSFQFQVAILPLCLAAIEAYALQVPKFTD